MHPMRMNAFLSRNIVKLHAATRAAYFLIDHWLVSRDSSVQLFSLLPSAQRSVVSYENNDAGKTVVNKNINDKAKLILKNFLSIKSPF